MGGHGGLGFRVESLGARVEDSGLGMWDLGFWTSGFLFRIHATFGAYVVGFKI